MLSAPAMQRHLAPILPLACLGALAACATPTGARYPSLAIRDVERAQGRFQPVPAAPLAVPEVGVPLAGPLAERVAALDEQAASAHRGFLAATPRAERLADAGSGTAIGSDAWASAQVALADLDSARSLTAVVLAELDMLMVARAVQAEDISAIEQVRQRVLALVGEEDATLERLRAQVR